MLYRTLELKYTKIKGGTSWIYYESSFVEDWIIKYKPSILFYLENSGPCYKVYSPISKVKYWEEKLYQYVQKQLLGEYDELITKTRKFNDFVCEKDRSKNVFKRSTKNK